MSEKLKSVELVIIGEELMAGAVADANVSYLASKLLSIGVSVSRVTFTGDDPMRLREVLAEALRRSRFVITSGGLGPTSDDATRSAAASLFSRKLYSNKRLLAWLRKRYKRLGRKLTPLAASQAEVPRGAKLITNPLGAAPGIILKDERGTLILLPGVPAEVKAITEPSLLDYLKLHLSLTPRHILLIRTAGRVETEIERLLTPLLSRLKDVRIAYLPKRGTVDLRIEAPTKQKLNLASREFKKLLGEDIYSVGERSLSEITGELLLARKATLAVAESSTGGMLASRIVDIPGSSRYFLGGVISYSNEAKEDLLGVPHELLTKHGAVSAEVAQAMAEGVSRRFGSTFGIGITGIAGPGGGTKAKPVGLVYISIAGPELVKVERLFSPSTRNLIRESAVIRALDLLRRLLLT